MELLRSSGSEKWGTHKSSPVADHHANSGATAPPATFVAREPVQKSMCPNQDVSDATREAAGTPPHSTSTYVRRTPSRHIQRRIRSSPTPRPDRHRRRDRRVHLDHDIPPGLLLDRRRPCRAKPTTDDRTPRRNLFG